MHVSELIDELTKKTSKGAFIIKPLSEMNVSLSEIEDTTLWQAKTFKHHTSGEVKFGQSSWGRQSKKQKKIHLLDAPCEIALQIRAFSLLKYLSGDFEGCAGYKAGTVITLNSPLKKLGEFLIKKGYTSFHQLNDMPELKLRDLAHQFFNDGSFVKGKSLAENVVRFFDPDTWNYSLLSDATHKIFHELCMDYCASNGEGDLDESSHPIIPTRILKTLIQWSLKVVNKAKDKIDSFEELNQTYTTCITSGPMNNSKGLKKSPVSKLVHTRLANNQDLQTEMVEALEAFKDLQRATFLLVLAYTGMRIEEAREIRVDSASEVDGTYTIISTMSKTDDYEVELPWVANKDVYEAVEILSRVERCFTHRAIEIISNESKSLTDAALHNLQAGIENRGLFTFQINLGISYADKIKATSFDRKDEDGFHLYQQQITEEDLEQLNATDSNIKSVKGKNKGIPYQVGDIYNLTAHMFRHTFAWFIMANRLGTLDDIKYQFNHLSAAMTLVYTHRGIASADELISIYENHERRMVSEVSKEITEQGHKGQLGGGGGERFNKAAQSLVIGITDGDSNNPSHVRQIHFENIDELNDFLERNLKHVRGLPHGYCTGAEECKIKNAAVPTGCVYCNSYTVTERHMSHWAAMRKYASDKLAMYESLPEESQKRYELLAVTWQNAVMAANQVITNHQDINNNEIKEAI